MDGEPVSFKHKQRESHVWKGMVWGSDLLQDGLRWTITNGRSVRFWMDVWVGDEKLLHHCTRQIEEEELERRVQDYWHVDHGWRWELLSNFIGGDGTALADG